MKIKRILFVAVVLATIVSAKAQKGVDSGTQFGKGEDSIRCVTNISLYQTDFKVKNYAAAFPLWKAAYEECPAATKDLYMHGVVLIKWQMSEEKDPAKQEVLFNELMAIYDKRIQYFGDDPRYGKDWIMVNKVADFMSLKGENADPEIIYDWLNPVIEEFQEQTNPQVISFFMFASRKLMGLDAEKYQARYIQDFLRCSSLYDAGLEAAREANDETTINNIIGLKADIEGLFATSGAADCATMENVFGPQIEANKTNLEFLKETLILFRRVQCQENAAYFLASDYAHRIEPTAESAQGLGRQAFIRNEYDTAEKYFLEAAEMTTDLEIKGNMYYTIATMASNRRNYQKARQFSLRSLEANPNQGKPYKIIAIAYASTASSIFPNDPVLTKLVYCLAVEKLEKARQVEPAYAGEVNSLISQYRNYFPTTEDVFMHPDVEAGSPFTIGGWINERTIVRVK